MGKADFCCGWPQQRIAAPAHTWDLWLAFVCPQLIFENPQSVSKNKSHSPSLNSSSSVSGFYGCAPWRVSASVGRQVRHPFCFHCCPFISCFSSSTWILFLGSLSVVFNECALQQNAAWNEIIISPWGLGANTATPCFNVYYLPFKKKKAESRKGIRKTVEGSWTWHDEL